jgi:hypothetical protein
MTDSTLNEVQRLVDRLTPLDQARLLAYLAPRVAHIVESIQHPPPVSPLDTTDAWKEFFRIGDALAASDTPESETLTAAVLATRR